MKSRERVLEALNHKEPDRVPIDFGGMDSSSITGIAYNELKNYLGISTPTRLIDPAFQVVKVDEPISERFHSDVLPLFYEPKNWKPDVLPDGSPCCVPERWSPVTLNDGTRVVYDHNVVTLKNPSGSNYFDTVYFPLKEAKTVQDIEEKMTCIRNFDLPAFWDEGYDELGKRARFLHEKTDYAIMAGFLVHIYMAGQLLRGFDTFIIDLVSRKELAHFIMRRLVDSYKERFDHYLSAVDDRVHIIQVSDDLGTQIAPQLSPTLYQEMVKPYHKELFTYIKNNSGCPLFFHSDGSIAPLIPHLIDAGVDILNPVQVSCRDMNPLTLKEKYGQKLVFWGAGCDTQRTLPYGTSHDVEKEVKQRIEEMASGGGYVFTQIHNIQPDVPPQNVVTMFDTAYKYGKY